MKTTSVDLLSLEELSSALATYSGPAQARTRPHGARHRWMSRRLALAVALVALLIAGCSYVAQVNPYRWISAADHPATSRDTPPAWVTSGIADWNKTHKSPSKHMVASTARFVHELRDGIRFYTIATTNGGLCIVGSHLPRQTMANGVSFSNGGGFTCEHTLTPMHPIAVESEQNATYINGKQVLATPINYGLAVDGVTAISFGDLTVPVTDNAWAHIGRLGRGPVILHFNDGRTRRVCWAPLQETWTTHRSACPVW